jgi:hypothetical protein
MTKLWHNMLNMPKEDRAWHERDMADEMAEYFEDQNLIMKWSELSDVTYTCSRGRWSGHDMKFPFARWQYALGLVYMYPKYTSRWLFFRRAGKKLGASKSVDEVRNPRKVAKLHSIAERYGLDKDDFQNVCAKQLKYWPLLP